MANLVDLRNLTYLLKSQRNDSSKIGANEKELIILRSDLTNKVGYESKEWHLKAPLLNWMLLSG